MLTLSTEKQKQIVGGMIYKAFYSSGGEYTKCHSESTLNDELSSAPDGKYHVYVWYDDSSYCNDYWCRVKNGTVTIL